MKPYETIQELLEDSKIHGPYVKNKHNHNYYLITRLYQIDIEGLKVNCVAVLDSNQHNPFTSLELFEHFIWQDGHQCGKSIEV